MMSKMLWSQCMICRKGRNGSWEGHIHARAELNSNWQKFQRAYFWLGILLWNEILCSIIYKKGHQLPLGENKNKIASLLFKEPFLLNHDVIYHVFFKKQVKVHIPKSVSSLISIDEYRIGKAVFSCCAPHGWKRLQSSVYLLLGDVLYTEKV